jgi:hypothetical protein
VLLSEKRGKERAARLAAARAGKPAAGGKAKKTEAQKKVAADFYKQVCLWRHFTAGLCSGRSASISAAALFLLFRTASATFFMNSRRLRWFFACILNWLRLCCCCCFCCFWLQMIVDSEYQGEDYEQFDRWLGVAQ